MSRLIISTGDVSDVDGFYALAEYAKTGADCLFIMNYPSYVDDPPIPNKNNKGDPGLLSPGLGYSYPASSLVPKGAEKPAFVDGNDAHQKLTNYGYTMAKGVWEEVGTKGALFFQIGGVNSINPFSSKAIKIEPVVYEKALTGGVTDISQLGCKGRCTEGTVFTTDGQVTRDFSLNKYDEIYMDFCGSVAFLTDDWLKQLEAVAGKIKGVFIMGGVRADVVPETLSAMPGILNRFSCATMNQLYHAENSAKFFNFLEQHNPREDLRGNTMNHGPTFPVYIVTNNAVPAFKDVPDLEAFLDANDLKGPFLRSLEVAYYQSPYAPPKKQAFDFYTAKALTTALSGSIPKFERKNIYYDDDYGVTLVAPQTLANSNSVLATFDKKLDDKITFAKGIPPLAGAIPGLEKEKEVIKGLTLKTYHGAFNVKFVREPVAVTWNTSLNTQV